MTVLYLFIHKVVLCAPQKIAYCKYDGLMNSTQNNLFKMVNVTGVASILGVKVWTIRQWVSMRKIPFYRVGRLVRFKVSELERWVDANKVNEKVA